MTDQTSKAAEGGAAGAAVSARPVAAGDRFESLDVLRGVAVLGILMLNVQAFMMAPNAYIWPPAQMDYSGANATTWLIAHVFFELKFITIFSALFGAGVLLMVGEDKGASKKLHFSRMRWLLIFGLVHLFGLWFGDILTTYAIAGFIIVFFRHMSPGKLIGWGLFWITLAGAVYVAAMWSLSLAIEFGDMTAEDLQMAYTAERMAEMTANYQNGFLASRGENALNAAMRLGSIAFFGGRVIGVMFIGMALFKLGFLTAKWSVPAYVAALVVGLGVGLPIVGWGGLQAVESGFALERLWINIGTNYAGSLLVSFGYAAAIMLICKAGFLKLLRYPFAAAGRMAFTNYLTQTLTMVALATGVFGPALWGRLERVEQAQLVLIVWAVQLIVSPLWLSVFRFGPFEWLWRSLSYGKLQPIFKARSSPPAAPAQ